MNQEAKASYSQPSRKPEYECLQKFNARGITRGLRDHLDDRIEVLTPDEMRRLAAYVKQACYEELKKRAMARGEDVIEFDEFRL